MALVGLGRETNLVAGGLLVDRLPADAGATWLRLAGAGSWRCRRSSLWFLYVRSVYPPFRLSNPGSFASPFSGYLSKWEFTIAELQASGWWGSWARFNLAALVSLTMQAAFLLARREWGNAWWRAGAAYCAADAVLELSGMGRLPRRGVRVLLPMSVRLQRAGVRSRWFWPLVILGNLSVFHGIHDDRCAVARGSSRRRQKSEKKGPGVFFRLMEDIGLTAFYSRRSSTRRPYARWNSAMAAHTRRDLLIGQLREHRQRQDLVRDLRRHRQAAAARRELGVRRLLVDRDRVVDARLDALLVQEMLQLVALRRPDDEQVIDVGQLVGRPLRRRRSP